MIEKLIDRANTSTAEGLHKFLAASDDGYCYVKMSDGRILTSAKLVETTLSDGSTTRDIELSFA